LALASQKLQQLMADSPWEEREVWRAMRREVILLPRLGPWLSRVL
jgi:hypothetical protein